MFSGICEESLLQPLPNGQGSVFCCSGLEAVRNRAHEQADFSKRYFHLADPEVL